MFPIELTYYAKTLHQGLEIEIHPFLIRQLTDGAVPPGLAEVDFITTSFFHFVEVRSKIRQHPELRTPEVFAITVRPHLDVLLALSKLPANANVGIVYFEGTDYTAQCLQAMVEHIESVHLQNIRRIEPIFVQGELDPARLRGFDAILIRPKKLAATHRMIDVPIPVITYENVVDQASLTMLRWIVHEVRANKLAAHQVKQAPQLEPV